MRGGQAGRRVFLLLACLYLLSLGRGFYSSDGEVMFHTTAALVEHGTFALEPDPGLPQIVMGQGGRWYSKYDPGLPLLAVPFYVTGDRIGQINRAHRTQLAAMFVLMVPALTGAGAVTALAALARRLSGTRRAVGVALVAGLATPIWPYARILFAESVLACALAVAAWAAVRAGEGQRSGPWLVAAGMAFGVGIVTRAAFAVYAPALAILVAGQAHDRCARQVMIRLAAFAAGMLPFGVVLLWHNALRFGDPFQFGYAGEGFSTPVWEGVIGLLFSPGKSVFLYAPSLVLSVLLWPRFRRAYPALGACLAAAWIAALAVYGAWWAWHGGWCWGPRLLVPLIPVSLLPLVMLPGRVAWRVAAGALVALGIGVQVLGVLTDVTPHYTEIVGDDESRVARVHYVPGESPLAGAVRRLAAGQTEPLALFHLGDSGLPLTWRIGVPLLAVGVLVIGAWGVWAALGRTSGGKGGTPHPLNPPL